MPGDDLKLNLRLTADGKGFVGEVRVAKRELDKLTGGVRKGGAANAEYTREARRSEAATRSLGKSFLAAHGHTLKYVGGIGGITLATRGLLRHTDSYTPVCHLMNPMHDYIIMTTCCTFYVYTALPSSKFRPT